MNYYVLARLDSTFDVHDEPAKGKYALVTSRSFDTFADAETYANGVAPSREPKIVLEVSALPEEKETEKPEDTGFVYFGMNDNHW